MLLYKFLQLFILRRGEKKRETESENIIPPEGLRSSTLTYINMSSFIALLTGKTAVIILKMCGAHT